MRSKGLAFVRTVVLAAGLGLVTGACGSMVETHELGKRDAKGKTDDPTGLFVPYALPNTLLKTKVKVTEDENAFTVTLTVETEAVPDPKAIYWLSLEHSAFGSDTSDVEITRGGLLTKVAGTHDPKTSEIVEQAGKSTKSVASTAIRVAKLLKARALGAAGNPLLDQQLSRLAADGEQVYVQPMSALLDTQNTTTSIVHSDDYWTISATLHRRPGSERSVLENPATEPNNSAVITTFGDEGAGGVRYRLALPYDVEVKAKLKVGPEQTATCRSIIHATDNSATFVLPFDRGFLVKREVTAVFDNGVLKSVSATRPSEVLAFLGLPLTVAEAVVSVLDGVVPAAGSSDGGSSDGGSGSGTGGSSGGDGSSGTTGGGTQ